MTIQTLIQPRVTRCVRDDGRTVSLVRGMIVKNEGVVIITFNPLTELPSGLIDGNILEIIDNPGTILGVDVAPGDFLLISDNETKVTKINQPALAAVATSGDYNDLDNLPAIPTRETLNIDQVDNTLDIDKPVSTAQAQADQDILTQANQYSDDRGKTAYDHSQATGNPHGTSFSDLLNQSALFNLVYSAYTIGSNVAIAATDALGEMLGKLQAQINNKEPTIPTGITTQYVRGDKTLQDFGSSVRSASLSGLSVATSTAITAADSVIVAAGKLQAQINNKEPSIDSGTTAQYWRGDKTWRSFATDVLNTVLTGFSASTATPVTATDNNLIAIGKLQAQINALSPSLGGGLTFNQSRWIFNDFDSGVNSSLIFHAGYIMASIGTGTRVGVAGGVGTQGILRFISAAAANTGHVVSNASAVPNLHIRPLQGSCCLFVAALPSGGSSRLLNVGFDATTNWAVTTIPTNSVHAKFTVSGSTVSASCRRAVVGTTTTQGSTVLTDDVYYVYLVQYVADDQVRFVIWNLLTNVKVFDETIVTDTPTTANGAILFHGIHATGINTQPLVDIDYIGRGIELPPYFVIPT